ncbi:phosphotransferase [Mycobacterium hackensackense]|uniref:phosphotransferase n=1 Tax=Mycobacterium hackensackense TaxID=228909 RepID=UPI002265C842|nr:phosphotransferase [Mycobacterium hackensackense]MCV7250591.1 phosphotransferase [Mycobacterium hackensackense]
MTDKTIERSTDARWDGLEAPWPTLFASVERTTGGRILEWKRQARWRPAWFLTVEIDGELRRLYARCQREEAMPWTRTLSLRREYDIMRVLYDEGVAVPAPLAFCEEPEAILMASVDGRDRFDERDNPRVRDLVIADYVRRLVAAHRLDTGPFEAIGLSKPSTPQDIGYMGFGLSEKWYREVKPAPDPVIEFIVAWLHRHVPAHRHEVSWIHFDAGQFLHADEHVTALMDVEFSCLGDPMADLGAMRIRDTAQPIGDLTHAYTVYANESGQPIDRAVVNFHAVRFALLTAMLSAGTRADPPAEFDLAQWQAWSLMSLTLCLEIIAEESGFELDPPPALTYPTIRNDPAHLAVQRIVDDILADENLDDHAGFRLRVVRDLLPGLQRSAQAMSYVDALDQVEADELLGFAPRDWRQTDEELEDFVRQHGATRETEVARLLVRRLRRQIDLIEPGMRDVREFGVQRIDWAAIPTK